MTLVQTVRPSRFLPWLSFFFSAFSRLLERLLQHKLHHAGLHRERCHRYNLARILVSGELFEHAVCQICPGGKSSAYVIFSHLIVSDGWRLKETRGPDTHTHQLKDQWTSLTHL